MTSRLDRLFVLLENSGSSVTRKVAAQQLGDVVKQHPDELTPLLDRLLSQIVSKTWETRIAAGQAVEAIANNVSPWDPPASSVKGGDVDELSKQVGRLCLSSFSITDVLKKGTFLVASDENQFQEEEFEGDLKENLARQRKLVNQKLGLDVAESIGIDSSHIVSVDDFNVETSQYVDNKPFKQQESVAEIVNMEIGSSSLPMSTRELNRAKRKARMLGRQKMGDAAENSDEGPDRKKIKRRLSLVEDSSSNNSFSDESHNASEWPFADFCDVLCTHLFSTEWETRHGAATALREIIKVHGSGAGLVTYYNNEQNKTSHESWLGDVAVRLCCVLALDRFGDFISDQVVAPVRETSSQVLGGILHHMKEESVYSVLKILQEMLAWKDWETRHGGLLGLRYLLAVQDVNQSKIIIQAYPYIYKGLNDNVDDVVAMAASCLVPVSNKLVETLSEKDLSDLVNTLWESLLEIDDLTASTNCILMLLAKLVAHKAFLKISTTCLSKLVPRLWSFLYHNNVSVRKSALETLAILTAQSDLQNTIKCDKSTISNNSNCDNDNKTISSTLLDDKNVNIKSVKTENDLSNNLAKDNCTLLSPVKCEDMDVDEQKLVIVSEENSKWIVDILKELLCHVYQRSLLESSPSNLDLVIKIWNQILSQIPLSSLLVVVCPLIAQWLCLIMINSKQPLDSSQILLPHHKAGQGLQKHPGISLDVVPVEEKSNGKYYLGGLTSIGDVWNNKDIVVRAKLMAAKLLGTLSNYITKPMPGVTYDSNQDPLLCYVQLLISHFTSRSSLQRIGVGIVVREWMLLWPETEVHELLISTLHKCLSEIVYYDEIAISFTRLQQDVQDFISSLNHYKLVVDNTFTSRVLTLEQIEDLCKVKAPDLLLKARSKLKPKVLENLESRRKSICESVVETSTEQIGLSISTQAILAGAVVCMKSLPTNLNPVIKPLMDSIKKETNEQFQNMSASDLTALLELCISRNPSPNKKIIRNLSLFLCVDSNFTPNISVLQQNSEFEDKFTTIFTLYKQKMLTNDKGNSANSSKNVVNNSKEVTEKNQANVIQRRGCTLALQKIAKHFGKNIIKDLPNLWELIMNPLDDISVSIESDENAQNIVNWLQLLEVLIPVLDKDLTSIIVDKLSLLSPFLYHKYCVVRNMASRVFGELARIATVETLTHVVSDILPKLMIMDSDSNRLGAIECIHLVINSLDIKIVPYIVLLIVELLGRNSDPNKQVRLLSAQSFAALLKLLPLEGGVPNPPEMSSYLLEKKAEQRLFLDQLMNFSKAETYSIPTPIKVELRLYQQEGVNWLAFLNKYQLHGILCDDMGLGKTLQSICILAGEHFKLKNEGSNQYLPSLVICPPTLTGHWIYEIEKFVDNEYLNPLHYAGLAAERMLLRPFFPQHNLIVVSYDIVRNEIQFFSKQKWNYIVLDEGHVIKNGKTKLSKAIKMLHGKHRIILTGTPIQNNVLELWSLFDFLIPGFLGTERQFISQYSRPILQSRDPKSTGKEQEAGVLAMEALHRQVLPFILRRVKEDVLKDLPPKITQDYYCQLSPLQISLYEDFARTRVKQNIVDSLNKETDDSNSSTKSNTNHIFQALQYLRRLCSHPKLVIKPQHPEYQTILNRMKEQNTTLDNINHSAKLPALQQLLMDCGIGVDSECEIISPHRVLIFCQLKNMLDIIENDLFKKLMPSVTYLRLDGSVPANQRHGLVQKFNSDPSIDVFLLTTQVGGLGLNLTGADTVIFVEHDWNPMRDLQAMDRAHRIGQKKVVNVYRLITTSTLEEKIMGLQKFKLMTANTVISKENSSMLSMETSQLLDLFVLDPAKQEAGYGKATSKSDSDKNILGSQLLGLKGGIKNILENMPDLWDETQYESEYDFENFMLTLRK